MHMFNVDYVMSLDICKQPRDTISKIKAIHMQHLPELSCVLWFLSCVKLHMRSTLLTNLVHNIILLYRISLELTHFSITKSL